MMRRSPSVAIVGAGMSGLCMAAMLHQTGVTDITILEKADEVGGTWRDNTYPGLSCDIPSRFYQFTFAPKPDWTRFFSPGGEIGEYFRRFATEFDLRRRIRFGTTVTEARFEDGRWRVWTDQGDVFVVDFLISATGILREPRYPTIDGLADFHGPVMHSARWDHSVDPTGKRVAVIGTGSTGVQIVCGLEPVVGELKLFQRSAQWVVPVPNPSYTKLADMVRARVPILSAAAYHGYRSVFEFLAAALVRPGWQRRLISALCRANLRTVTDPDLRRRLTPDYQPMCRRLVISAGFYRAMQRPHVALVDTAIDHVEQQGIVTAGGRLHEVDAIVLATGFDAHAFMRPMNLIGQEGITIDALWSGGPVAHLGVGLPGFPNFFMLMGPHSPVGNYSLTAIAEHQCEHILRWVRRWQDNQIDAVAPSAAATAAFNAEMRAAMPGTVWATGCTSWYLGKDGVPELWPWTPDAYRHRLAAEPNPSDYDLVTPDARLVERLRR
ncbi:MULTISPECIES: NAD(P)/FAD-dependent oxidoreductase [Mycobacteroides]|uniref:Monooxygenase n=1 Tax=Mycobacteroides chelonae TaxID=1774 RepID=A0A1S1LYF9_MYCCH|nr:MULTISPECIES: NAD(P)/FAD-dependent oxidoreductase [Mycobacteroides]KRQ25034.1 monooxygenase [Mycobacteroides sp. H092]KRQ26588.1 monooxygenase [Mycobacteroides sp. H003]KRQ46788.1 monooxygenase [Mycobacteroides sp. H101]KRQ51695.1 monooxygenase [Mycobacteroides sp. H063]KRQ61408.1 monooxygenase [Mycobacteroides sp. HXVII]